MKINKGQISRWAGQQLPSRSGACCGTAASKRLVFGDGGELCVLPTVLTVDVYDVDDDEATVDGDVISEGDSPAGYGFVYSDTQPLPTLSNATPVLVGSGSGPFSATITGLLSGVTYYVRAYAKNDCGTSYGAVFTFTTTGVTYYILAETGDVLNAENSDRLRLETP